MSRHKLVSLWLLAATFVIGVQPRVCSSDDSPSAASSEAHAAIDRLTAQWAIWRQQAKTVEIDGYRFLGVCHSKEKALTVDEVVALLSETLKPWLQETIAKSEEVTLESVNSLPLGTIFPRIKQGQPRGQRNLDRVGTGWSHFVLLQGPDGRRVDLETPWRSKSFVCSDGKEQDYDSSTKQVSLRPSEAGVHVDKLDDILYMPRLVPLESQSLAMVSDNEHMLKNSKPQSEFEFSFNPLNGFVNHTFYRLRERGFVTARYQALPFDKPGEPAFPRLVAQMSFSSSQPQAGELFLHMVTFYVISSVEYGVDLTPGNFQLAAPAGTALVDFENKILGTRPTARRIKELTIDALATAHSAGSQSHSKPVAPNVANAQNRTKMAILIGNNVAALFAAMMW